jgi:hypothetical protein
MYVWFSLPTLLYLQWLPGLWLRRSLQGRARFSLSIAWAQFPAAVNAALAHYQKWQISEQGVSTSVSNSPIPSELNSFDDTDAGLPSGYPVKYLSPIYLFR